MAKRFCLHRTNEATALAIKTKLRVNTHMHNTSVSIHDEALQHNSETCNHFWSLDFNAAESLAAN